MPENRDRTTEQRLRAAIESSPSGLLMIDAEGRIVLVNREIERLFGYSREDLLGRPVDMLVPERFRGVHPGYRKQFFADPSVREMGAGRDLYGRRSDGSEVPVEIGLTPVATEEGLFVLSAIVDISGRKRAEERFRAAVESAPAGMVMVDDRGTIVLVNREVERLFGYAREELLGAPVEKLVPERFRARHPAFRQGFMDDPEARPMGVGRELFGLHKDGSEIPVEIGLNPIETEEGLFVLSSIVDISARKRAEEERRRLEEQLRQSQKLEAVGTLAGGIAHDFNNILGAIVGFAELARGQVAERPEVVADLDEVLAAARRGREIVERILQFSRRHETRRTPNDLGQIASEARRFLRPAISAGIELRLDIETDAPPALVDPTSIHQVIMNLVTNSSHAMPGGGQIVIAVEPFYARDSFARRNLGIREGPYVRLTVRDTGTGIDPAVRDRVFEPFFTTKPGGAGSGLGLAMVRGIVRDHDGSIAIESEPGAGTTVHCFFPAIEADPTAEVAARPELPRGAGERILYVDDEEALARSGSRRLRAIGYRVEAATDPSSALTRVRQEPDAFDLVITDYAMPGLNGLDLARLITEARPGIPIVLLTGFIVELAPERMAEAGVKRILRKPVTTTELGQALREVLGTPG